MEKLETSYISDGNIKQCSHFRRSLAVLQKVTHWVIIWLSDSTLRYTPKWIEKIHPHKHLYINVCSSIIHNSQKYRQPKCPSTDKWINKMWYNHITEHYLTIKRNEVQSYLILLRFALLCCADIVFFYKLKVFGNPASSKSIATIFPTAFAHFMSLCHILVILAIFQTSSLLLYL